MRRRERTDGRLMGGAVRGRKTRAWAGAAAAGVVVVLAAAWTVETTPPAVGQGEDAAVMAAAGQWVLDQLPGTETRLDPHRSGEGKDGARVRRVAQLLGASLVTLEDTRQCTDAIDASTCRLDADRLLAIGAPRIDGGEARVKVYAWYRSGSARAPVSQRSWDVRLQRDGGVWRVVS